MKPINAVLATTVVLVMLTACSPVMKPETAGKVQQACADLGLVSTVSREDNRGVNAVTCSPAATVQ